MPPPQPSLPPMGPEDKRSAELSLPSAAGLALSEPASHWNQNNGMVRGCARPGGEKTNAER
jgi:hypothetical protein